MNQIETNAVETETAEFVTVTQTEDAINELNAAQLMMVGGGSASVVWD